MHDFTRIPCTCAVLTIGDFVAMRDALVMVLIGLKRQEAKILEPTQPMLDQTVLCTRLLLKVETILAGTESRTCLPN